MTSGMNSFSAFTALSSASKCCITEVVSISLTSRMLNHPARFFSMLTNPICMYGSSSASMPPNFWTSSVCSSCMASITSSTVITPMT